MVHGQATQGPNRGERYGQEFGRPRHYDTIARKPACSLLRFVIDRSLGPFATQEANVLFILGRLFSVVASTPMYVWLSLNMVDIS